ncbi:MAG TPA: hypoxanthine phosphoribosyltransferase, partial [Blastocatellia bacterium]|nr:hypoxanthine phosphoribosyltransferase [Blastocatellia bacterium]
RPKSLTAIAPSRIFHAPEVDTASLSDPTMSAAGQAPFFNDPNLEVLIESDSVQNRVREIGRQITSDYAGKNLHLVGVLKGACVFMSDLMRNIDLPMSLDFIGISSYGAATKSSGEVRITKDLDVSLAGKDVLVVEDIIDTGLTLNYLVNIFKSREANSLAIAALLDKPERHEIEIEARYIGFTIPNRFVVGYGLDAGELYRNLPYIGVPKDPTDLAKPER